jgi:methylmalonyl-CoA/ethylmalonyl-CoA epimerase
MQSTNLSNKYGLTFHHLGLAVDKPKTAAIFLEGLGYKIGKPIFDPQQNVNLLMCDHPAMPSIEVIYPAQGIGPLDRLLKRHKDGLVYHMCYTTQNLEASLATMEEKNDLQLFCVSLPKQAILFGGKLVSFYLVSDVGLIEIIDESK